MPKKCKQGFGKYKQGFKSKQEGFKEDEKLPDYVSYGNLGSELYRNS
jgi:hypothetical protein